MIVTSFLEEIFFGKLSMRIDLVMTFDRIESVYELWKFVH